MHTWLILYTLFLMASLLFFIRAIDSKNNLKYEFLMTYSYVSVIICFFLFLGYAGFFDGKQLSMFPNFGLYPNY